MNVVLAGLSPGVVFAGCRIEEYVGRGGMGVIYRATELRPERTVALKVVAPELAADPGFRERFLRESQIAASIEHPHVVPVSRVGEDGGLLFIAMRFIPGRDLAKLIATEGRFEPRRAVEIVDQLADALDTAHEQGLVHRDVKPANVLVERRRREHVYLTDFGLTKRLSSTARLTATGMVVGTTDYMAPEQWTGAALDARVDVYSLGCLLFELLTGRVPYPRAGQPARMYAHLNAPLPTVSDMVSGVPAQFDQIVKRALAKDPNDRYPSAGDLGFAALAAAEGRSIDRPERTVAAGEAAPTIQQSLSPGSSQTSETTPLASGMAGQADESSEFGSTEPVPATEWRSHQADTDRPRADQRGEAVAGDLGVAVSRKRRRVRLLSGVSIAGVIAVAVAVVLLLAGSSSPNTARSGPLALSYGSPWRLTKQSSPTGFALRAPAVLSSGQTTLALGAVENSASVPGDAPPAMVARFGHPISSSRTRVAEYQARRYVWDPGGGRGVIALVIPTASVDLSLICDGNASADGALGSCEALAAGITVSGATPIPPGVDRTLSRSLEAILAPVSEQRNRLGGSGSSALPDRAQALGQAASVEQNAVGRLSGLSAPRNTNALTNLRATLSGEAASLLALSQGAAKNDASAYDRDRSAAISASRKLTDSVNAFKTLGFTLPSFAQLRLAAAPATAQSGTSSSAATTSSSSGGSSTSAGASSGGGGGSGGTTTSAGKNGSGGKTAGKSGSGSTPVGP